MDINKEIAEHTTQVEAIITKYLPKESGYQKTVMEAMNYSFLAGGKRLRPMLMQDVGNPAVARAVQILAQKAGIYGMLGGQVVDVESEGQPLEREKLDFIYDLKTGALIEASMLIGAVLAGASEKEQQAILQVAKDVGLAFQIQDDILDVTSDMETLGKPIGSDEKNHKTTYVTIRGLAQAQKDVEKISERALEGVASLSEKNVFLNELIRYLIHRKK